jgi:hypothetical protein
MYVLILKTERKGSVRKHASNLCAVVRALPVLKGMTDLYTCCTLSILKLLLCKIFTALMNSIGMPHYVALWLNTDVPLQYQYLPTTVQSLPI